MLKILSNPYLLTGFIIYSLVILLIVFTILLQNRNPSKTVSYVISLLFFPVIGLLIYLFFGLDYRKRKKFTRKNQEDLDFIRAHFSKNNELYESSENYDPKLLLNNYKTARLLMNNERAPLTVQNSVKVLTNGENKYVDVINCLKAAKHHIHIEYFILSDDHIGNTIKEILMERAKQGIKIRLIYDALGSSHMTKKYVRELRDSGAEVEAFLPVLLSLGKVQYRNHRKVIIIDGRIGFVGGINVDDKYINDGKHDLFWRDTHLKIEGEAIKSMQILFILNWRFCSKKEIEIDILYFPTVKIEDKTLVQISASGPDSDWQSIMQAFFVAITNAKFQITITNPYFIPNTQIIEALKTAALSGIDVQIILPGVSDSKLVNAATRSFVEPLLKAGCRIFFYQKGFVHAKIMTVDDSFSTVGTTNMDVRSFDIDFEINALIYDKRVTARLLKDFEQDKLDSDEVIYEEWKNRPFKTKLGESLARVTAPIL